MPLNPRAKPFVPGRTSQPMPDSNTIDMRCWLMPCGVVRLHLRKTLTIEFAPSGAVKVLNHNWNMKLSVAGDAGAVALYHPKCVLSQNDTLKVAAFARDYMTGYAFCRPDSVTLARTYDSECYCIADDGTSAPLNRALLPEELMFVEDDSVYALFARELRAADTHQTLDPLDLIQSWQCGDVVHYCVYGFHVSQMLDGKYSLVSPATGVRIEVSTRSGTLDVTTPFLTGRANGTLREGKTMYFRMAQLKLYSDGKVMHADNTTYSAALTANAFVCRPLYIPPRYMYAI